MMFYAKGVTQSLRKANFEIDILLTQGRNWLIAVEEFAQKPARIC